MKTAQLRVQVEPGLFSTERVASFRGREGRYTLLVDAEDVADNRLLVYVLQERNGEVLIQLPRETMVGSRVFVPTAELENIRELDRVAV